jgi:hypothetical protein
MIFLVVYKKCFEKKKKNQPEKMSTDGSLESKLSKLMKALRGVDPEKLAEKQHQHQEITKNNNSEQEKKQEETSTVPNNTEPIVSQNENEKQQRSKLHDDDGDFADLQILEVRTTKQKNINHNAVPNNNNNNDGFSVESLMKQFVSTLRQDIQTGNSVKTSLAATTTTTSTTDQQQLPDYSAMSMEELLDQIDELVDQTTTSGDKQ